MNVSSYVTTFPIKLKIVNVRMRKFKTYPIGEKKKLS